MRPRSGDTVFLGAPASVQFGGGRGIHFRIIRRHDWSTSHGWGWYDGYELNEAGDAVARRNVYVQEDGIVPSKLNELRSADGVREQRRPVASRTG